MELSGFRKNNAKVVRETFYYEIEGNDKRFNPLKFSGEFGKVELTFDERDKQAVIDLLRNMADSLNELKDSCE